MQVPITGVPVNIVDDVATYMAGYLKAAINIAGCKGKLEDMSPIERDATFRALKKNTTGLLIYGLAYSGYLGLTSGGFQRQKKSGEQEPETPMGRIAFKGQLLPKFVLHHPMSYLIEAAGTHRQMHDYYEAHPDKSGSEISEDTRLTAMGMMDDIPFISQPKRAIEAASHEGGTASYTGAEVRGMVSPGLIQTIAQCFDPKDKNGNPIKGKPKGFWQNVGMGFPYVRQNIINETTKQAPKTTPYKKEVKAHVTSSGKFIPKKTEWVKPKHKAPQEVIDRIKKQHGL
jgi:hypothetical protein